MKQYQDLIRHVLDNGTRQSNRTGIDTLSVFGYQMRFDLTKGFPATTTKKLAWKSVVGELLWFLEGSTDERRLAELTYSKPRQELVDKKTIWTENADAQGKSLGYRNNDSYKGLGPIYGFQWRNFDGDDFCEGIDQIRWLLDEMKNNPDSRRLMLTAWNPNSIQYMALPPCHAMVQFRIMNNKLNCQLYQRSADIGLGIPFNIASYALLTHIFARHIDIGVGDFVHTIGDAHIYEHHYSGMRQVLKNEVYTPPTLKIKEGFDLIEGIENKFPLDSVNQFVLENYISHPSIKMDMAV